MKLKKPILIPSKITKNNNRTANILLVLSFIFMFLILSVNSIYDVVVIDGLSMYPTANANSVNGQNQDNAIINFYSKYTRGDIIIAKISNNTQKYYVIKRVIALGGDTLTYTEIDGNLKVVVNGEILNETYINPTSTMINSYNAFLELKNDVKFAEYFSENTLTIPKNYVFYMGDNRDNSTDCNFYGPVSVEKIIAKVEIIVPYNENPFFYAIKIKLQNIF